MPDTTDKPRCSMRIFDMWHGRTCVKSGTVQFQGKWYCAQHNPEAVAARHKARDAKWEAASVARQKVRAREAAVQKFCAGVPTEELERFVRVGRPLSTMLAEAHL